MSSLIKYFIVIALLLLSSCTQNQPDITDSERIEIENAINHVYSEVMKASEQADVDKMFSFILENNKGVLIRNGQLILSRQEALDTYKKGFRGLQKVEYKINQQYITALSSKSALLVLEGESIATTNDGQTFKTPFAQTTVFVSKDGDWRILHAHTSAPVRR